MSNCITPLNFSITLEHATPYRSPSPLTKVLSKLFCWKRAHPEEPISLALLNTSITSSHLFPQATSPRALTEFIKNPLFQDDDLDRDIYVDVLPHTEEENKRLPQRKEEIAAILETRFSLWKAAAKAPTPPPRRKACYLPLPEIPVSEPIYNEPIYVRINDIIDKS